MFCLLFDWHQIYSIKKLHDEFSIVVVINWTIDLWRCINQINKLIWVIDEYNENLPPKSGQALNALQLKTKD